MQRNKSFVFACEQPVVRLPHRRELVQGCQGMFRVPGLGIGNRSRLDRVRRVIQQTAHLECGFQVSALVSGHVRRVRLLLELRKFFHRAGCILNAHGP